MNSLDFRQVIEKVRGANDIAEVIGRRLSLDHRLKALCPFHEEKSPSFSLNPKGQYFHCFGCGVGGDVFKFLELYQHKPFMDVLSELAQESAISLSGLTPEDRTRIDENRRLEDILTETARFYHQSLIPEVKKYLTEERGFTEETISSFSIGYAKGGLRDHLANHNFPLDFCFRSGVLKNVEGGEAHDYFYHRIIFPNLKHGRVVHLSGRSIDGRQPKYLHLPGEIHSLFNEDVLASKDLYVAEGIPDCISAVQAGYPSVAILGSGSFKAEFLPRFSRCDRVYLCLDGDEAGQRGARSIGELLGERARIVELPEGLDLNDYLKDHSKEDLQKLIDSAKDIIKYELSFIPTNTDKTELPRRLEPILKKLSHMEKAKAEAYLSYEIKPRFRLKTPDIDGYRELIIKYRQAESEAPGFPSVNRTAESVYTALFDGLVDLVEDKGSPAFLLKEGQGLSILPEIERDGVRYVPPPKEQIPWLLPRGEEIVKLYELEQTLPEEAADSILYDDLLNYHQAISELPGEQYYDLIVAWDLHTYLLEAVEYSPIVCLFAVPERGKTRTGKGIIYVAHRGIHVESLRDAYLVRVANDLKASIFFDVKDIWQKAEKYGSEDILLHRFEKGATVPRVLFPDRGAHRDIVYYSVFGPTIVSTNEGVHRILETRAVPINMPETSRRFENNVTPELSLPLKERLVSFRARHLGEVLPEIPKPASGRLGDILKPLLQIVRLVKPEKADPFLELVRELEAGRLIEKADSLEAQLLMVMIGLREDVERGILPVKAITDTFNEGKAERNQLTYQRVGRRLSAMGFKKAKTGDGSSALVWDEGKIERMKESFGLGKIPEIPETSETWTEPS